jgi:hypothetical protein
LPDFSDFFNFSKIAPKWSRTPSGGLLRVFWTVLELFLKILKNLKTYAGSNFCVIFAYFIFLASPAPLRVTIFTTQGLGRLSKAQQVLAAQVPVLIHESLAPQRAAKVNGKQDKEADMRCCSIVLPL